MIIISMLIIIIIIARPLDARWRRVEASVAEAYDYHHHYYYQ